MAKRVKAADTHTIKGIAPADLKKVLGEISRQKKLASEYAGNAGKATQNAVETHGLEKTALTFTRRLNDMETGKRGGVVRSVIEYFDKAGFFDQIDAFDDVIETMRSIVARVEGSGQAEPATSAKAEDKRPGPDATGIIKSMVN